MNFTFSVINDDDLLARMLLFNRKLCCFAMFTGPKKYPQPSVHSKLNTWIIHHKMNIWTYFHMPRRRTPTQSRLHFIHQVFQSVLFLFSVCCPACNGVIVYIILAFNIYCSAHARLHTFNTTGKHPVNHHQHN